MNPFDTTVGLKGITEAEVPIWVNDLPGLSTELVEAVVNSDIEFEEEPGEGVGVTWGRVKRLALDKLQSLLEGELSKSADFQFEVATTQLPDLSSTASVSLASSVMGAALQLPYMPYSEWKVVSLTLHSLLTETVQRTLSVFDLRTGATLHTQTVNILPGHNALAVSLTAQPVLLSGLDVFVGIAASGLTLMELGSSAGSWSMGDSRFTLTYGSLPATGSKTRTNLTATNCRVFVSAVVRCSLTAVVEKYADRLGWCYAYLCGSLLLTEKLASSNVNLFTNTNRLFTEELEPKFMEEARTRLRPVARTIVKELRPTPALSADSEFQGGYYAGGFV